jgi:hypothetical protein
MEKLRQQQGWSVHATAQAAQSLSFVVRRRTHVVGWPVPGSVGGFPGGCAWPGGGSMTQTYGGAARGVEKATHCSRQCMTAAGLKDRPLCKAH